MVSAFTVGVDGPTLSSDEVGFLTDARPWGVILFARNIETPDQVRALTGHIRAILGDTTPILIDQEGGRVQRMFAPTWRQWLPPLNHVTQSGGSARAMYLRGLLIGHELADLGIDVNCAPTCDVANADTHPFLRNRCFGETVEIVTKMARAMADGLLDAGVLPVMKHMPGHGRGRVDSHFNLPVSDAEWSDLQAVDFAPFHALRDLPMGMTAHMLFPKIDDLPVTVSSRLIKDVIRGAIGFKGLLMSDDIGMEALGGTVVERALAAQAAGCDLVLHCNGDLVERRALAAALPPMSEVAQTRASAAMAHRRTPVNIDIPAHEAELAALMGGHVYG
ncbi:beta-N-acetylhexosaminidase [Oceaniglobus ichthyenteri]|uniref:beta-N-acetylhexosaminidase n=1 Tax=Oceaniglobus ichthyenteri TaxID=2136177 RepID=UPI000D3A7B89|nr:beta-N-acetylhexosaminidase [Oceaniglobus ichthyenteri]